MDRYRLLYRYLAKEGDKRLRDEGAYESLMQKECSKPLDRKKMKSILEKWDEKTEGMDGRQLAGFLLKRLHMIMPRDTLLADNDLVSVRTKLYQMVERISVEDDAASPKSFYHRIDAYVGGKQDYDISLKEDTDAVRIMNMHKCKGLEAKIVILADRSSMDSPESEYYLETINQNEDGSKRDILDWKYRYYVKDMMPADIEEEGETEDEAEKLRQLYVITTRAEEALIIMPYTEKKRGSQLDYMQDVDTKTSEDNGVNDVTSVLTIPKADDIACANQKIKKFDNKKVEISVSDEQLLPCLVSLTPSGLEHEEKIKKNVEEEATVTLTETEESFVEENQPEETRPYGNIFGTVMHRAFELMMDYIMRPEYEKERKAKKLDEAVIDFIPNIITCALAENMEDIRCRYKNCWEEEADTFRKYLSTVLESFAKNEHILDLLSKTKRYETEYEFSYYTNKEELGTDYRMLEPYLEKKNISIEDSQQIYINGSVDLLLFTEDGMLHIIDYKSDSKGKMTDKEFEKHRKKYDGQLTLYRIAMSRVFHILQDKITTELYDLY